MNFGPDLLAFIQIVLIDISLAGDNAIIIGMAAAGLAAHERKKAVIAGIIAATVLRIIFAIFAVQLLGITGLLAAGGLLLLWVSWKMYQEIRLRKEEEQAAKVLSNKGADGGKKKLSAAIWQIVVADVSMSLDNVLAVAGVARDHMMMLVAGLGLSVVLMGVASSWIARLTAKHHWIAYLGLAIVFYTALHMIWDGSHQLMNPAAVVPPAVEN